MPKEKPRLLTDEEINLAFRGYNLHINKYIKRAIAGTLVAKTAEVVRGEILKQIEAISRVIDWGEDIGDQREMKESDYQALKSGKPKEEG